MALLCIAAAVLGVFIGMLSGMLGVGGGTMMVPAYRLIFDLSAIGSTATSLFTMVFTSISGVAGHVRNKTCIPKLGVAMGLGGACTSFLGVRLAAISPGWAIMLASAVVIAYTSINMLRKTLAKGPGDAKGARAAGAASDKGATGETGAVGANSKESSADKRQAASLATPADAADFQPTRKQLGIGFCIGLITGVASGYIGLGGGFIMVPLMLSWLKLPMKKASGTSLIGIFILAIPAAIQQALLGNVDFLVGIATAVGTVPGAFLGARLVTRIPERSLRMAFSIFLCFGAVLLVVREFFPGA